MREHGVAGLPKVLQRTALAVVEECAFAKARSSEGDSPDCEGEIRSIGGRFDVDWWTMGECSFGPCAWSDSACERGVTGEAVLFSASEASGFTSGASALHLSCCTSGASAASSGVNEGMVDAESLYLCCPATAGASARDRRHKGAYGYV